MIETVPNQRANCVHFAFVTSRRFCLVGKRFSTASVLLIFAVLSLTGFDSVEASHGNDNPASPAAQQLDGGPVEVARALHAALANADEEQIRRLLAEDVIIFESGNVESSLAEYASHHMPSDMAFMSAMTSEVIESRVIEGGDTAAVLTRSRIYGTWKEQEIDLVNTETLVLQRNGGEWKIVHVHWSSN